MSRHEFPFSEAHSIVDVLAYRAERSPDKPAYTFLLSNENDKARLTYAELDRRARAIAARLRDIALPGERALLLYPWGPDFVTALFGCFYSGIIAVPAHAPDRGRRIVPRLQAIARQCEASLALTSDAVNSSVENLGRELEEFRNIRPLSTSGIPLEPKGLHGEWKTPEIDPKTIGFLQY